MVLSLDIHSTLSAVLCADVNGDGNICRDDILSVLQTLTKNRISPQAALKIANKVTKLFLSFITRILRLAILLLWSSSSR